jgi:hypothetical protein
MRVLQVSIPGDDLIDVGFGTISEIIELFAVGPVCVCDLTV